MKRGLSQEWHSELKPMIGVFNADARNQMIQADPWLRAVNSMLASWRIRHSQRKTKASKATQQSPPCNWAEAAFRMAGQINAKAKREQQTPWERWAKARAAQPCRYIPKSQRPST